MKKLKISLAAGLLFATAGVTLATSSGASELTTYCSAQPNGQSGIGTPAQFGCNTTFPVIVCCYRIPDNVILYKTY